LILSSGVYKDPITDSGKRSKRGKVTLWESNGEFQSSVVQPKNWTNTSIEWKTALKEVFRDGVLSNEITFAEIRANARK
jgi:nicotinamide phosphoribosyltransferase